MTNDLPRWTVARLEEDEEAEQVTYAPFLSEAEALSEFERIATADRDHRYVIVEAEVREDEEEPSDWDVWARSGHSA